jgi:2-oxoglutarate/2-oxoacid ferredoxin oxidoreductase subunit alpha
LPVNLNLMIGGEAGQGVQLAGYLLAKTLNRGGYHVFADQDYDSRVRGGHSFFRVRVKEGPIGAISEPINVLVAFNRETIEIHRHDVSGIILGDVDGINDAGAAAKLLNIPLARLAGNPIMENMVALGAVFGLLEYDFGALDRTLREHFGARGLGEANAKAARAGYDHTYAKYRETFGERLSPRDEAGRMLLNGNEAVSLGAIAAGCKFMSAYPMTPTSPIMEYLAAKAADFGLVMVQTEDEIAAMNMAIGAAFAGVRAMTATSGSGFCLMVEGLGLAGITETPVVVVEGQRPGPAVGLPTRTEQGDLEFVLHAHHGEFPRAVLAPASVEDAFWLTIKAFNMAEKYQVPVIIMTDQYLSSSYATVEPFDIAGVTIDRGLLFTGNGEEGVNYKRHRVTPTGVSPRAFPGMSEALVLTDADEHDEAGHLAEDAVNRKSQVEKRLRKHFSLKNDIATPVSYGLKHAETTLIGWGSTGGAIKEAVSLLQKEGMSINTLQLNEIWPFPADAVVDALSYSAHQYVIENNATGQLARIIKAETGKEVSGRILKYDGRPFTPASIAEAVRKECCF